MPQPSKRSRAGIVNGSRAAHVRAAQERADDWQQRGAVEADAGTHFARVGLGRMVHARATRRDPRAATRRDSRDSRSQRSRTAAHCSLIADAARDDNEPVLELNETALEQPTMPRANLIDVVDSRRKPPLRDQRGRKRAKVLRPRRQLADDNQYCVGGDPTLGWVRGGRKRSSQRCESTERDCTCALTRTSLGTFVCIAKT